MAEERKRRGYVDWPYVLGLTALPVLIVALLFGVRQIQELTRYDPAYFANEYLELYDTPGAVARALELALREGDATLMAELTGTKDLPTGLTPEPRLIFVFLLDVQGDYFQYLYFNSGNFNRVTENVKQHHDRYVVVEPGLYFYIDSGLWTAVAAPIAATWWILLVVYTAATYVYRRMAAARQRMFDR